MNPLADPRFHARLASMAHLQQALTALSSAHEEAKAAGVPGSWLGGQWAQVRKQLEDMREALENLHRAEGAA
jgi:hypothetical protein